MEPTASAGEAASILGVLALGSARCKSCIDARINPSESRPPERVIEVLNAYLTDARGGVRLWALQPQELAQPANVVALQQAS